MEKREYRRNAYAMIYLAFCAVNGRIPKKERIEQLDLNQLFEVCQEHILTACVAYALESVGIRNYEFTQAKEKAVRKNILLDVERKKILDCFENEHIWYMSLKGSVMKNYYPKLGMRQMSDNDILFDSNNRRKVKDIMNKSGFICKEYGVGHRDVYFKEPVCNFELHNILFTVYDSNIFYNYYSDVKSRLISDENHSYEYHFTDEDFYLYMISHEYKHFSTGGTGVRSVLDTYVYMKKFHDSLDWDYISAELQKLGIADFERENRELAMKVFGGKKLSCDEKKLLDYYIFSGTYGTVSNSVKNKIARSENGSEIRYVFHRIFPTMEQVKAWYPFFYKHKIFMPFLWFIVRPLKFVFLNRKNVIAELKYLIKHNRKA